MPRMTLPIAVLLLLATDVPETSAGRKQILRAFRSALYAQVEMGQIQPQVCNCVTANCRPGSAILSCGGRLDTLSQTNVNLTKAPLLANEAANNGGLGACLTCTCNANDVPVGVVASAICLDVP